jgi:flagellar protein FlbT
MALKVELKPGERIILGDCVITNSAQRTRLLIEGEMPVLREKDIMTSARADTLAKRIYLAVQLMYLAKNPNTHQQRYFALAHDLVVATPSTLSYVESINKEVLSGAMYKALKAARKLIDYESELLDAAPAAEPWQDTAPQPTRSIPSGVRGTKPG